MAELDTELPLLVIITIPAMTHGIPVIAENA